MTKEGWTWIHDTTEWHYFVDSDLTRYDKESLCGRYALLDDDDLEQRNDDSPDNCAACKRKLKTRKEQVE